MNYWVEKSMQLSAQMAQLDNDIKAIKARRAWLATSSCVPTFYLGVPSDVRTCDGCGASHRAYHRTRQCVVCAYCGRDL